MESRQPELKPAQTSDTSVWSPLISTFSSRLSSSKSLRRTGAPSSSNSSSWSSSSAATSHPLRIELLRRSARSSASEACATFCSMSLRMSACCFSSMSRARNSLLSFSIRYSVRSRTTRQAMIMMAPMPIRTCRGMVRLSHPAESYSPGRDAPRGPRSGSEFRSRNWCPGRPFR